MPSWPVILIIGCKPMMYLRKERSVTAHTDKNHHIRRFHAAGEQVLYRPEHIHRYGIFYLVFLLAGECSEPYISSLFPVGLIELREQFGTVLLAIDPLCKCGLFGISLRQFFGIIVYKIVE